MGERLLCKQDVAGSIPVSSTDKIKILFPVDPETWSLKIWLGFKTIYNKLQYRAKELSAYDGCLGTCWRWKTWQAAISFGEMQAIRDPKISEWSNPLRASVSSVPEFIGYVKQYPGNWNISVPGGKENKSDSPSSGERTGMSLNRYSVSLQALL